MMTRYFYDDPLAAAWMEEHFDVRLQARDTRANKMIEVGFGDYPMNMAVKLYIHPDSLALLEPQVGDLIDISAATICPLHYVEFVSEAGLDNLINPPETTESFRETGCKIIQRNGKAFHWPQQESENDK